jgi:hypothetical protein
MYFSTVYGVCGTKKVKPFRWTHTIIILFHTAKQMKHLSDSFGLGILWQKEQSNLFLKFLTSIFTVHMLHRYMSTTLSLSCHESSFIRDETPTTIQQHSGPLFSRQHWYCLSIAMKDLTNGSIWRESSPSKVSFPHYIHVDGVTPQQVPRLIS